MLTLYGSHRTRSSRITWMLEEIGAQYNFKLVRLEQGEHRQPWYLALNPMGKVPTLQDDELILCESAAIVTYLGDKYALSGLVPKPGGKTRARYDQACYFCLSELEQPLWTSAKHSFVLPEDKRVPAIKDTARWEFDQAAKVLSQRLGDNTFILGEQFTAADILTGHTLSWARNAKCDVPQENLIAYAERVLARPALTRAYEREQAAYQ